MLDSLRMARQVWDRVTPSTIANCFRKGSFVITTEGEIEQEELEDQSLVSLCSSESCTFMKYAMADNNLSVAPSLFNADIIALVR